MSRVRLLVLVGALDSAYSSHQLNLGSARDWPACESVGLVTQKDPPKGFGDAERTAAHIQQFQGVQNGGTRHGAGKVLPEVPNSILPIGPRAV